MKCRFFLWLFLFIKSYSYSQLQDVKIIIPKDPGFSYYDFLQFFPDEKYFVMCGNGLTVYNTETAEVIDEADLSYGAKNLSVSKDGKYVLVTVNNELFIYSFINQKLNLYFKSNTAELIKGLPNSEYYGALPIGGSFFTSNPNELYVSIGSFTLIYNFETKQAGSSYAFPLTEYIINSAYNEKKQEVLLAISSGTNSLIMRQPLQQLDKPTKFDINAGLLTKMRVRDSLMFCFSANNYFILNLDNGKVVHEVRMPLYDSYGLYDASLLKDINKRPSLIKPDTVNFAKDEYVYDIDYLSKYGQAVYATAKGIKFIDLKTKKLVKQFKTIGTNLKFSKAGNRMVCMGYSPYKALRIYDPNELKLVAEKVTMGSAITSANISPNNRWLYTNGTSSGYVWDLKNFSKYVEIKDVSESDSAYIYGAYFLNDSEVVVNSGKSFSKLNLAIYNIHKKKYIKTIKKNVYTLTSGFRNDEFYYCDYSSLHIVNLKTLAEEKYTGLFSLAASPLYNIVEFNKDLVFVPEASSYKIINRKTKKAEYESSAWSVNARVIISLDGKSVFTTSQVTKKKNFNGVDVDMPTNAIVKIDMTKKAIVQDYAQTYFPYDFKLKDNGKVIAIWYVKYDVTNYTGEQESMYTEYDVETGKELVSKTLVKTKEIISYHFTSENGKYFALATPFGEFFKVFDEKGDLIIDLSQQKFSIPKCFFIESKHQLVISGANNSLATFVDLNKKQIIGQLANAVGDHYFLITSDLHYLGSKEFVKNIRFKYQSEIYSFEQFDAYLNQPHKVLTAFACTDTALITAYEKAYLKRMKVLGLSPEAKINFSVLPNITSIKMSEEKPGFVKFDISANKGQNKLSKLQVENNGTLIHTEAITAEQSARLDKALSFEATSGINRFQFTVFDDKGISSPHTIRFYNNTVETKPNLYLVVVGSEKFKDKEYDLTYAVKDAGDIANTMVNSKAFNKVVTKKLFNQAFLSDSVKNLKQFFSKAGVNDVVMVFYAGHGYLDTDLSYYFPTYYTDFTDPKINSVAYKSFETLFQEMKPIRKLMFIDACFSGEADEEGTMQEYEEKNKPKKDSTRAIRIAGSSFSQSTALEMAKSIFSDLRQNSGVTVISSAGGTETAFESEKWNNGLFTHCLIDAMTQLKADENKDKKITLTELQKFVAEEVNRLSDGSQTPTYRVENNVLDYELW